jgi:dihydroneopterin aldolase
MSNPSIDPMTLFLASVRDPVEAELALHAGADIVDLKDPGQGALGALAPDAIAACVKHVAARAPISATIGDPPLTGDAVRAAVLKTAALGVDYVKFGLFPGGDAERCLNRLKTAAARIRLIVVLFADALPNIDAIGLAAKIGAHGVMFDTMGKGTGSLPDHMSYMTLAGHIATAKAEGLVVGLAGSLKAKHVPSLLALAPDLLGFRGALCQAGDRAQTLDEGRLAAIRALIPERPRIWHEPNLADLAPQALC